MRQISMASQRFAHFYSVYQGFGGIFQAMPVTLAAASLVSLVAQPAQALQIFSNRADFYQAVGQGFHFESFEDLNGLQTDAAGNLIFQGSLLTVTEETTPRSDIKLFTKVGDPSSIGDQTATDGQRALTYYDDGTSLGTFRFNLPSGINAFGLDISLERSLRDNPDYERIEVLIGGQTIAKITQTESFVPVFFGVYDPDNTFNDVQFSVFDVLKSGKISDRAHVHFDAVAFGNQTPKQEVPTPALLPGLIAIGIKALRKRRADESSHA
jgi:hypothetical protein